MIKKDSSNAILQEESSLVEILLETPSDVQDFFLQHERHSRLKQGKNHSKTDYSISVAKRLLGPPNMSLLWRDRQRLFRVFGEMKHPNWKLTKLHLEGTIMGQVIAAETLATAISPSLQVLQFDAGLIFDNIGSVLSLAEAFQNDPREGFGCQLQHIKLSNFLNHVRPIEGIPLLDPLMLALTTIPTLRTLELSCLASFVSWDTSYLSTYAINTLQCLLDLEALQLSNVNLGDEQFEMLVNVMKSLKKLHTLKLNSNNNTKRGLGLLIDSSVLAKAACLKHLEVRNHARMDTQMLSKLVSHFKCCHGGRSYLSSTSQLEHFKAGFDVSADRYELDYHLRLNRLHLSERYFSPTVTPYDMVHVLRDAMMIDNESIGNDNTHHHNSDYDRVVLDCLYTLLRENPSICDTAKNAAVVHDPRPIDLSPSPAVLVVLLLWMYRIWFVLWIALCMLHQQGRYNTPGTEGNTTPQASLPIHHHCFGANENIHQRPLQWSKPASSSKATSSCLVEDGDTLMLDPIPEISPMTKDNDYLRSDEVVKETQRKD